MQLQNLWLGIEPAASGSLDRRSTNWATEAVDESSLYIQYVDGNYVHITLPTPLDRKNVNSR